MVCYFGFWLVFVCFVSSNSWTKLGCRYKKYLCLNVGVGLAGFASRRYHGTVTQLFTHHELSCNRSAADLSKAVALSCCFFFHGFSCCPDILFFFCTSSGGFEVLRGWHLFTAVCLEAPQASHKDDEFDGISTARCGCVTGLFYRDVTGVGYLDTDRSDDRPHRWRWWHPRWLSLNAVTTSLAGMLVWFLEEGVYSRWLGHPVILSYFN